MISRMQFAPPLLLQRGVDSEKFPLDLQIFGPKSDRRAIYALRYRAFIEAQLIQPRADALFFDAYDDLETTCTLAAFQGETCVGSFRLTFGEPRADAASMPCQSIFPAVADLRAKGYDRLVEFTRMAIAPDIVNTSFRTTLYAALVRAGLIIAHAHRTEFGLISVHPNHVRFYTMMCGFRTLGRATDYPGITEPAVLLGRSFRALDAKRSRQNPFFRFTPAEVGSARDILFANAGHVAA